MRKQSLVAVGALALLLGCGGGGGSSAPAPTPLTPPGISNFSYTTASSWPVGYGGGATTAGFRFDFIDNGGDVTSIVMEKLDSSNHVVASTTTPLSGTNGVVAGVIVVAAVADTTVVGTVNWRFHVVDARGSVSNDLYSSYTVTASDLVEPAATAPPTGLQIKDARALAQ